jgi:hypothetical protein
VTGGGNGRFSSWILHHGVSSLREWLVGSLIGQLAGQLLQLLVFVCEDELNTDIFSNLVIQECGISITSLHELRQFCFWS